MCGPRSFTRSKMLFLFLRLVTLIVVPKGRVWCAAVNPVESKISPLAVVFPSSSWPYQLASPTSCFSQDIDNKVGRVRAPENLASDLGENAMRPTTAQPVNSLFIHPPIARSPCWTNSLLVRSFPRAMNVATVGGTESEVKH